MPDWPLVGRARELDQIRDALGPHGRGGLVLAGPAGVGKTRLGLEGLALAEKAGMVAARVTGTRSAAGLPFGALSPLIPAMPVAVAGGRGDLLRQMASGLVQRAGGRRLALLVDDAHLLDDASATLVHQLVVTGSAFVLATVRSGEPAPDSVTALWKDNLVDRIAVQGFAIKAVDELLVAVLGAPVDPATASRLTARTQGNPLFLRELIRGSREAGALRR